MQIGELFILRINIHLNGSILDSPELFWTEPRLEPVYMAVRSKWSPKKFDGAIFNKRPQVIWKWSNV